MREAFCHLSSNEIFIRYFIFSYNKFWSAGVYQWWAVAYIFSRKIFEIAEKNWHSKDIKKNKQKPVKSHYPFESLSFVEYSSFIEYFLYENSTLMLKSLYNLNLCSVASIVRWHELNVGYFVWIHLKFKWKWAFCGWLEKCNYLVHLSR